MSSLSRELVFLILEFLDEEKFKETVHKLEQESGFFFNMKYFEDQVQNGEWGEVDRYLSAFTKVDDNRHSMKIFFEIRKQKYLEALDRRDRAEAVEILVKDLKVFSYFDEEVYKEITQLLTLENFRENEQLSKYGDTKSARSIMLLELKKLIEANPLFTDKLAFPSLKASRLRTLINHSLNWQHHLCKNPRPNPDIKTLFIDHSCGDARAPPPANNPLVGAMQKPAGFPALGAHPPFQPSAGPLAGWMPTSNSAPPHAAVVLGRAALVGPAAAALLLMRARTPPNNSAAIDYQMAESDHLLKRSTRVMIHLLNRFVFPHILQVKFALSSHQQMASLDNLPMTPARSLSQGSSVTSMDFHPTHQTVLLVGTSVGEISVLEVATREKLVHKTFEVWDISVCSVAMQAAFVKEPNVSVQRVVWSSDGALVGVAFSKFIVHLYMCSGSSELRQHQEIDAHVGGVNDLAFSHPDKQLCLITCGDDKTIKVWDAMNARKLYVFEGHVAPVYSVCPHHKESIQFIFSTAIDGKIKAWLYDNLGSRVDYDAPGRCCTTMAYSADGTRLFSCGTSKDGESFLVEWNESDGAIKRNYTGFRKRSNGVVQFDTTRNRFLAAGEDFCIKIWDMDNTNLLTTIDADSGLPPTPRLRFNKEGSLLAVTTQENGIRILASNDGLRLMRSVDNRPIEKPSVPNTLAPSSGPSAPAIPVDRPDGGDGNRPVDVKPRVPDETMDRKNWKFADLTEQAHCRSLKLNDSSPASRVLRLIYTNAGNAVLALGSNAVHKLWKWQKTNGNVTGKATANVVPQLWQPQNTSFMTNDISDTDPEEAVPCIALSKNDSYMMSASGGKALLFNMMTFKVMASFMPPPPAATFLAFHPQDNNFIAIGMEDSTIHIYNLRIDEVKNKLKGHQKRITGLAFSNQLNVLVSSGADAQICLWGTDGGWDKRKSKFIQMPPGKESALTGDTRVQFDVEQTRLLVVHESQLAIYDAAKLEPIHQWFTRDPFPAPVSNATFSCDSELVYAAFCDGSVGVFETDSLRPRCRIAPSTYLSGSGGSSVYPLVVAAHPSDRHQIALGLSDGGVQVLEPVEPDGKWGPIPSSTDVNGAAAAPSAAAAAADQSTEQAAGTRPS